MTDNMPTFGTLLPSATQMSTRRSSMEKNMVVRSIRMISKGMKGHIVAAAGEFVGTFLFLLFGEGALNAVNDAPMTGENLSHSLAADTSKLLFISLAFGFSLAINVWVFFRISGGLFNPAVTLGMLLIGKMKPVRAAVIFIAQIVGGIAASAVVYALTPGPLLIRTQLGGGTSIAQGLFIEMFLAAELVFTIFMLAAEKHEANFIAPIGIGLALFIAQLFGTFYTGCSVNPARSFGPDVVLGKFAGYHWIYWVGPGLGAIVAAGFYKFIKALEYETVNMEMEDVNEKNDPCPQAVAAAAAAAAAAAVNQNKPATDRAPSESSGRTEIGDTSARDRNVDLEAQKEMPAV